MKNKIYRSISVEERLPLATGWYHTNRGVFFFIPEKNKWTDGYNGKEVSHWLEEIELPTEEEISEGVASLPYDDSMTPNDIGVQGANFILKQINCGYRIQSKEG